MIAARNATHATTVLLGLGVLLVASACGSTAPTSSGNPLFSSDVTATPTVSGGSPNGPPDNAASGEALSVDRLTAADPSGATYTLVTDKLLGGVPNTDARVFTNSKDTTVEIDIAVEDTPVGALDTYPTFAAQAIKNVHQGSVPPTMPAIGGAADETVGTNSSGQTVIVVSFEEVSSIVVITVVNPPKGSDGTALAEAIAQAQLARLTQ